VADEYRRRISQAHEGAAMPDEIVRLNHQMTTMRRGIGRLIDSYAEGVLRSRIRCSRLIIGALEKSLADGAGIRFSMHRLPSASLDGGRGEQGVGSVPVRRAAVALRQRLSGYR
jgi:hypothetical protein